MKDIERDAIYAALDHTPKIYGALARAQGEMGKVVKDSKGYGYTYASLAAVLDAIRPALFKENIALVQRPLVQDKQVSVETCLYHADGSSVSCSPSAVAKNTDPQSIGSAITYLRRYGILSLMGLAPEEDDDGAANAPSRPIPKRPIPKQNTQNTPRDNHPTTVEIERPSNGNAPLVLAPGEPVQDANHTRALKAFCAAANERNVPDDYQRALLGTGSRKDATPERLRECAAFLQEAGDKEFRLALDAVLAQTLEDMHEKYKQLPEIVRKLIHPACSYRKQQLATMPPPHGDKRR